MFRVFCVTTSDILDYDDVNDFNSSVKFAFDESVHDVIDELCDAYKHGKRIGTYEFQLGIKVVTDYTLDVYDLINMYC